MGQDIQESCFSDEDFTAFEERLRTETTLLAESLREGAFVAGANTGGFELEAWLLGPDMAPSPKVESLLEALADPLVVPELATFNAEINGTALALTGNALTRLAEELTATWQRCTRAAANLDIRLAMTGILPTVRPEHLTTEYMTPRARYRALNDQIFALRHGKPLTLEIRGQDRLYLEHEDVMLEAAATSFQIHLKVKPDLAARVYNASKILSAPMVAISANSPFLFGCELWDETRIPLFEQAVSIGESILSERVGFGVRYAEHSILEIFEANLKHYPVLLPHLMDDPPEQFAHLRLHNGTIWRWNRPLIGFEPSGEPHLRIEHRVVPAGPTVSDCIANAAFYYGVVHSLVQDEIPPEERLPFVKCRGNFYTAAREGLEAEIEWLDGKTTSPSELIALDLLPRARSGLLYLGINAAEADRWLALIEGRLKTGHTGAAWQRAWVHRHGHDMAGLTAAYLEKQQSGRPVYEWSIE